MKNILSDLEKKLKKKLSNKDKEKIIYLLESIFFIMKDEATDLMTALNIQSHELKLDVYKIYQHTFLKTLKKIYIEHRKIIYKEQKGGKNERQKKTKRRILQKK